MLTERIPKATTRLTIDELGVLRRGLSVSADLVVEEINKYGGNSEQAETLKDRVYLRALERNRDKIMEAEAVVNSALIRCVHEAPTI